MEKHFSLYILKNKRQELIIINPGKLDELIEVYSIKIEQNDWGDIEKVEALVGTFNAQYRDQTIAQATASIGTIYEDVSTFGVRQDVGELIDRTMTIKYENQKYSIIKITKPIKKNGLALIVVKAVV